MSDPNAIKIPLISQSMALKPLPGQNEDKRYALVLGIRPEPAKGHGYLVEMLGKRQARIIAWIARGGEAYACDAPLSTKPERTPDLEFLRYEDPDDEDEGVVRIYRPHKTEVATFFVGARSLPALKSNLLDLGPYAKKSVELPIAVAVLYLAAIELRHGKGANGADTLALFMRDLHAMPYPDALDALVRRGREKDACGFAAHSSDLLVNAGVEHVRGIAAQHDIDIRVLASTGLFWTAYDAKELDAADVDILLGVESALNVLLLQSEAREQGGFAALSMVDRETCQQESLHILRSTLSAGAQVIRASNRPNPLIEIMGTQAARGGEWDVRTRIATALEELRVPMRIDYRYDVDAAAGIAAVTLALPSARAFPGTDDRARTNEMLGYALRLSALIATACFGASVGTSRCFVTATDMTQADEPICSMEFARADFTLDTMGRTEQIAAETDIQELAHLLSPVRIALDAARGHIDPDRVIEAPLPTRVRISHDKRALPPDLAEALYASTGADLDIADDSTDPLLARFREIEELIERDPTEAIEALRDIIDTDALACDLQGNAQPRLYCSSSSARFMVTGLYPPGTRVTKLPDSAFHARSHLAILYRQQGNFEDAERLSLECVKMAPSSFESYHLLAMTYLDAGRMEDAVEAIRRGLPFCLNPLDIGLAYYRLGFIYWRCGNAPLGLACYSMVPEGSFFAQQALVEMRDLMQNEQMDHAFSRDQAMKMLRAEGVVLAPTDAANEQLAALAIKLVEAGFFRAAAPLVSRLATMEITPKSNDALGAMTLSLHSGINVQQDKQQP